MVFDRSLALTISTGTAATALSLATALAIAVAARRASVLRVAQSSIAPLLATPAQAQPARHPIEIVAAENFYGDLAGLIGGPDVHVVSILSNPDQDPHLFEASPSVARALSQRGGLT